MPFSIRSINNSIASAIFISYQFFREVACWSSKETTDWRNGKDLIRDEDMALFDMTREHVRERNEL
jgi:hypothetical protein